MNNANQLPITQDILNAACAALAAKRACQAACAADQVALQAWRSVNSAETRAAAIATDNKRRAALGKETKTQRALEKLTRAAVLAAHPELSADRVKLWTLAIGLENAATALAVLEA